MCAFDIETTRLPNSDDSIMYIWQFAIDDAFLVTGRTWDDFLSFARMLARIVSDYENTKLCIYVHNLSFEFQYLSGVYKFSSDEVFAVKSRKVLYCVMYDVLEFRCSYLLTNVGLREFLREMNVPQQKLYMDYSLKRYPWTVLTESDYNYCVADVIGLVEGIKTKLAQTGDTVASVPLTQTGYVRRDAKRALRPKYVELKKSLPDYNLYVLLREAFRGGNTHANRWYVGDVLENVGSVDIASSYPAQMVFRQYPTGAMIQGTVSDFDIKHWAWVSRVRFVNIRLRDKYWGIPYIPLHKTTDICDFALDNGRILSAGGLSMTITDVDYKIIADEYAWDSVVFVGAAYGAKYRYLPRQLRDLVLQYFYAKTEYKGIAEKAIEYALAKQKINSLYGMSAQDPAKLELLYMCDTGDFIEDTNSTKAELLEHSTAFMPYQWGVWVTAWARYQLEQGLKLAGLNVVYCDTDSVKFLGHLNLTADTKAREREAVEHKAIALDPKGKRRYLGIFELEDTADRFRTWGAKRYAYEIDGKLTVTIAGVRKSAADSDIITGSQELKSKGGIDAFVEGFTFTDAGGAQAIYNDDSDYYTEIDGHKLHVTRNVTIEDGTYTMTLSPNYDRLLWAIAKNKIDSTLDVCYNNYSSKATINK
mgnify:FL=1